MSLGNDKICIVERYVQHKIKCVWEQAHFLMSGVNNLLDRKTIEAIKRYQRRVDRRLALRGIRLDGRWEEAKHPRGEDGKFVSGGSASVKVELDGPKGTKKFISDYVKNNPEIEKEAKKYKGILEKVRNFKSDGDGTFSATTGERLDLDSGYCVTFHQNYKLDDKYGMYDDESLQPGYMSFRYRYPES